MEPWEKRCHALADVLDFHKIINTEEKRRGVESWAREMVGKLTYYERWIVAFANSSSRSRSCTQPTWPGRWTRSRRASPNRRPAPQRDAPRPAARRDLFLRGRSRPVIGARAGAEAIGSFCLTFTVIVSGFAWSGGAALAPVARALAVGPTLTALILLFGQVSGGHYNPLISLAQGLDGRRSATCLAPTSPRKWQGLWPPLSGQLHSGPQRSPRSCPCPRCSLPELFAEHRLMMIVAGAPRMQPAGVGPFAVGGFVAMTIAGLPMSPAANPIITVAALISGLSPSPSIALAHLAAEGVGLLLALLAISVVMPKGISTMSAEGLKVACSRFSAPETVSRSRMPSPRRA